MDESVLVCVNLWPPAPEAPLDVAPDERLGAGQSQHVVGAVLDHRGAGIPEQLLDQEVLGQTVAAEELDASLATSNATWVQ